MYKNILVIGSELHSGGLDLTTRGRGVSDIRRWCRGSGRFKIRRRAVCYSLNTFALRGQHAEELALLAPGMGSRWVTDILEDNDPEDESYLPHMNGQFVFKNAVVRFSEVIMEGLGANQMTPADIDMLIPHQANLRIAQFIQKKFGLKDEQVYNNIMRYGNTTAASIPIALTEAWEKGLIQKGSTVVLAAFGSGFTWGSVIMKW